jgi:hypothetical protein
MGATANGRCSFLWRKTSSGYHSIQQIHQEDK